MNVVTLKRVALYACIFFLGSNLFAQAPVFNSISAVSSSVARLDKFELNIRLTAGYTNPYDYDDIAVQAMFTAPSGAKDTVDGFYMKNYTIGVNGYVSSPTDSLFKVRYTPKETGTYTYTLKCTNLAGSVITTGSTFESTAGGGKGFIRKNATNYLSFDDNSQYIPIGENMGWQNGSVVGDYSNWMTDLANNGGNFIRVWMSNWAFALEYKNGYNNFQGLKRYKQDNAYYLDWLLEYCKQKNVYMMLTLNNHGQVSTNVNPEWSNNPYNAANGGPALNTWDFFTNATAKALHKNRLRYIIARYGYSQNIQSWELFNELHWTDQFEAHKNEITTWDDEMSTYIKSKDVNKHLVTTSYGGTEITTNTWSLPNIDFTQTHFYVNSPNIESILAAANQTFLSTYHKPTLNGEFGLGPDGNTLSSEDPNGVHIHNAVWGSAFSGSMGSAMTWWWDSYIEPKNLYPTYLPLSGFVAKIKLKDDDYKKVTAIVAGGAGADALISPGADWGKAPANSFTIDASGEISPSVTSLSKYLYGSIYNTANRNPPTFTVNFPAAGQFKVSTAGIAGDPSNITIYVDGTQVLTQPGVANTTYAVNVTAGLHNIKVDNLATDWAGISSYTFTGVGASLSTYVLKSADNLKASGYVLNKKYNWQYLNANGGNPPAAVTGSSVTIPTMQNGTYQVQLYNCETGAMISQSNVVAAGGNLLITMPDIAWDVAFIAQELSALPLKNYTFTGEKVKDKNYLHINIASSENIKTIFLDRSADAREFDQLQAISDHWNAIQGNHTYVDEAPLKGQNFYRLRIVDNDGRISYSPVVKIMNVLIAFRVYPNPVKDNIFLHIDQGKYQVSLSDQNGRVMMNKEIDAASSTDVKLDATKLAAGVYYLSVKDKDGNVLGVERVVK